MNNRELLKNVCNGSKADIALGNETQLARLMNDALTSDLIRLAKRASELRDAVNAQDDTLQAVRFLKSDNGVLIVGNSSGLIELGRYALQVASGQWNHAHIDETNFAVRSNGELTFVLDDDL